MQLKNVLLAVAVTVVASACSKPQEAEAAPETLADNDPRVVRHELMEDVGDAAKVVGAMLKGEREFDAAAAAGSLATFGDVAAKFGGLFPAGTETGGDTEAAPAIWEDRAGFDAALKDWADATAAAVAAAPATLEDAKPVLGAVFKTCKGCHDTYRIEDE
jgi:cytochrome c556